jgi:hypothetical protein
VWHLLTNAVKFTPKGGSVSVRTDNAPGRISITVSDTGIGMSDEQMKSLFEPFKQGDSSLTRRFGGLGIGLAICRRVIELHGGSIDAESRGKDQGSTFTVVLPLAEIMVSTTSSAPPSMQQLHPAH